MKAKSFADREIRYTLKAKGQGAGTFNIGPNSGIVKLAKELDFEDVRQPHIYQLVVTATEDSGGFSTSVDVSILVCAAMSVCASVLNAFWLIPMRHTTTLFFALLNAMLIMYLTNKKKYYHYLCGNYHILVNIQWYTKFIEIQHPS